VLRAYVTYDENLKRTVDMIGFSKNLRPSISN